MTRAQLTVAMLAASAPLLAGCPPPYMGTTETGSESESETEASGRTSTSTDPTTGPGPTTQTTQDTETSTTDPETTSTSEPTTGPTGCREDAECQADDPGKPFCVDNECVACDGAADPNTACATLDPALPVCATDTGACVVCTPESKELCNGNTPVCDAASNECAACSLHDDCPMSACDVESGACLQPEYTVWVDALATCDVGDGTMGAPFCKIAQAFEKIAAEDASLGWTVRVKQGNYTETELPVPQGAKLAIVGDGGIAKIKTNVGATLQVQSDSKIYLGRLNLSSNADDTGLSCTGAHLFVQDVTFNLNREGYVGTDCNADLQRVVFYKNISGAISLFGSGITRLTNSFVSVNGSLAEAMYGGIIVGQGHELHVLYSTLINNLSEAGARSLQCTDDAGAVTVRNSVIIAGALPSVACPVGVFEYSVLDEGAMEGDTNLAALMGDIAGWFEAQVGGVYRVKADAPISALAVWKDGDPRTDYDGDPRPTTPDSPDFAGADRPE